jgi:hypothetical protein
MRKPRVAAKVWDAEAGAVTTVSPVPSSRVHTPSAIPRSMASGEKSVGRQMPANGTRT